MVTLADVLKRLVALHESGQSFEQIAKKEQVAVDLVAYLIKKSRRRNPDWREKTPCISLAEAYEMYLDGEGWDAICVASGLHEETIHRKLIEAGYEFSHKIKGKRRAEKMYALYQQGIGLQGVAKAFSTYPASVRDVFILHGFALRPGDELKPKPRKARGV